MRGGGATRVLLVDDRALLAESLAAGLREHGLREVEVWAGRASVASLGSRLTTDAPEVAVLGLEATASSADLALISALTVAAVRVLVVTSGRTPSVLAAALEAGAAGVFTTDQPLAELARYVADAARGVTLLSSVARTELVALLRDREHDLSRSLEPFDTLTHAENGILRDLMQGDAPELIAARRFVAVSTVRSHIRSILSKLGVNSQLAAVTLAYRTGWGEQRKPA